MMGSAQRQQEQDLGQYKGKIIRLFIDERLPLSEVMDIMEKEYGVTAS